LTHKKTSIYWFFYASEEVAYYALATVSS